MLHWALPSPSPQLTHRVLREELANETPQTPEFIIKAMDLASRMMLVTLRHEINNALRQSLKHLPSPSDGLPSRAQISTSEVDVQTGLTFASQEFCSEIVELLLAGIYAINTVRSAAE